MKEQLKKADLLGLAIIAAALIAYSIRWIWTIYQTVAVVVGGLLVVVSIALKFGDIQGRPAAAFHPLRYQLGDVCHADCRDSGAS